MKSDKKKLKLNMWSALILQIVNVICGFILPRLILSNYGSEVNGLVSSITQFLSIISFFDCGMGIVVQSALYKPLVDGDLHRIDLIISSATKFFKRLAYLLLIYVAGLVILYPVLIDTSFSREYVVGLILILCIGTFMQYYMGVVDGVILAANQCAYISSAIQGVTIILNTIISSILIQLDCSIHVVRFGSMLVFLIKPIIIHGYVCKKYNIKRNVTYTQEPIPQKWNGTAQHIASVVLDNTDIVVLSLFDSISTVSIYSVYNLIVTGIRQIILTVGNGLHAYWGSLFAEKRYEELNDSFRYFEWLFHTVVILLYGATTVLICPFVSIYTKGVYDIDYHQPVFAIILVMAQAMRCIRTPYNTIIQAIGHYKQTQRCYVIAALINIVSSIVAVNYWGLVGVAIGTFAAMGYQLLWIINYDSKNIIDNTNKVALKHFMIDGLIAFISIAVCSLYRNYSVSNYIEWCILAATTVLIWGTISLLVNYIFYRANICKLFGNIVHRGK